MKSNDTGKSNVEDVRDFQTKFKIPQPDTATQLEPDVFTFRLGFMQEELDEFRASYVAGDLEQQFDALIDLVYVALGTALMMGLQWQAGWRRVQEANMAKVAGLPSKRHGTLDVTKPPGWKPADLSDLVKKTVQAPLFDDIMGSDVSDIGERHIEDLEPRDPYSREDRGLQP